MFGNKQCEMNSVFIRDHWNREAAPSVIAPTMVRSKFCQLALKMTDRSMFWHHVSNDSSIPRESLCSVSTIDGDLVTHLPNLVCK